MSVELCSLTLQRDDTSLANLVASGLFGDGAAAVVAVGSERATARDGATAWSSRTCSPPAAASTRTPSGRWAGTSAAPACRIVLDAQRARRWWSATSARTSTASSPTTGSPSDDIEWCVAHPGGPKVLEAMQDALGRAARGPRRSPGRRWPRSATCRRPRCCTCWPTRCADRPPRPGLLRPDARDGAGLLLRARPAAGAGGGRMIWYTARWSSPVGLERLAELVVSKRNAAWSLARGGVESGQGHYPVMVVLHTGLLVGAAGRGLARRPTFVPALGLDHARAGGRRPGAALVVHRARSAGSGTPASSSCPGLPRVTGGPYRFLSHPNYVAVVVEGLALPLVHSAWITALVFTVATRACWRPASASRTVRWLLPSPPRADRPDRRCAVRDLLVVGGGPGRAGDRAVRRPRRARRRRCGTSASASSTRPAARG